MNSFNILSAIKVNAAALADTSYNEGAEPYIKALDGLFVDFTKTIRAEKTAESAPTETTAKQNNSNILSDNGGDLSSYHVGQKVHTPYGDGTILEINKEYGDPSEPQEIGRCKACGWPVYEGDRYERTDNGLWHQDCKQKEEDAK